MTFGYIVSASLVVIESVSILCLIFMNVHHSHSRPPPIWMRFGYWGLAVGLGFHVLGQVELLYDYRPPRTWSWLVLQVFVNYTIWAAYLGGAIPRWVGTTRKER